MQYEVTHADLSLVLALIRAGTLARAAELMHVDISTVFRSIRRLEASLGVALFEKNRRGYLPTEIATAMAEQAEQAEQALTAARIALQQGNQVVSGTVRLTCTESVLHSLLLPALAQFMPRYPALTLELATSNSFANLSRRDADIALRLTNAPPEHLIGRRLGTADYLVCGRPEFRLAWEQTPAALPWISPDDSMPEHASVIWRKQTFPALTPRYRCSSMSAVSQLVAAGLGVAAMTDFTARGLPGVETLSDALQGCTTDLWLLTRPDCRALRSVQTLLD
ncbi:LysR family transcriptional regulator [Pseudomonas sp. CDFA 602]|uniref:LysR family transcriptional regulator n=1 Tax=Pseudomonas californiensis TaxID=2829823 RepID=UPI001E2EAC1F|nr:LysR family transcriptional regulator [Pseudomonas californiensis]MCD5994063.1 LysR family transcriptional regulator [Pseudomonas californiensis]MCD5999838.1 LysR family transcriptional regulator [Pseudomonas californiensis]